MTWLSARKYMYVGALVIGVGGALATYLNFLGIKCLSDLALNDRSLSTPRQIEEMERDCAIVTNSYVYSIYGVVAGIVLVAMGFIKKRKDNAS